MAELGFDFDEAGEGRLADYFSDVGKLLKDRRKRESFAMYGYGILGDGERKSAEPIAGRASADEKQAKHLHDKLLHFLARAEWDDQAVRLAAVRYALDELSKREPLSAWIVDDTGILKQGRHSVGVKRQYTGSAGKVTNCQVAVTLCVATRTEHVPVDTRLYLPEEWTTNPAKRKQARIPESVVFKTKTDLALEMIERASRDGIPGDILLADGAYGSSNEFRNTVRLLGFDYAVGVTSNTKVFLLGPQDQLRGDAIEVGKFASTLKARAFRRISWREGTRRTMKSRFCFRRVKVAHDDGSPLDEREPLWLVIEWPEDEAKPNKFLLTTLPHRMTKREIVRFIKERWRTERMYEDLKGELGFDHFEGRSFPGWHHHMSVVFCCYAFVVAERSRHFPPSERRTNHSGPHSVAA